MTVSKYPLDFEALEKGTIIAQPELEDIFGLKPNHPAWQFKVMALQARIKEEAGIIARQSRNTLVLMGDEEASDYNYESVFRRGMRKIRGSVMNLRLIDCSKLSEGARAQHESRARVMTGTQQAAAASFRKQRRAEALLEG